MSEANTHSQPAASGQTRPFQGIIAAAHTPMGAEGQLKLDGVRRMIDLLLDWGVNGFFVCGTTGEFPSLTLAERRSTAEAFVDACDDRVPVIIHVGHNSLSDARDLASHAASIGASGIAACPPSYFKPADADALTDCCAQITAGAPDLPFFYYHIPVFAHCTVSVRELLARAVDRLPSLVGVKFSSERLDEYLDCLSTFQGKYTMMFGKDEMLLSALAAGATAAVGSTYNYAAPLYRRLWNAYLENDLAEARLWQKRSVQSINILNKHGGVRASKAIMKLVGLDCGPVRLPLKRFTAHEEDALYEELAGIGFFEWSGPES